MNRTDQVEAVINSLHRQGAIRMDPAPTEQWVRSQLGSADANPAEAARAMRAKYDKWVMDEIADIARQTRSAPPPARVRSPRLVLLNDETGLPHGHTRPAPPAKHGGEVELIDDDPTPPRAA